MRKLLPKTSKNPRGFTLIELMIVITIMAILAVIAIAIYSGLQARARNAKRQGEVKAIADALEVNHVPTSLTYPIISNTWFPGGVIPTEFVGQTQQYTLIYSTVAGTTLTVPAPGAWTVAAAPAGPGGTSVVVANGVPSGGGVVVFLVCASTESEVIGVATRGVFCIPSAQ